MMLSGSLKLDCSGEGDINDSAEVVLSEPLSRCCCVREDW